MKHPRAFPGQTSAALSALAGDLACVVLFATVVEADFDWVPYSAQGQ